MTNDSLWRQIAQYVRYCPSPHNTQPFRLRIKSDQAAEIVFLPSRGLYVADPHGKFTWLTAGIFAEICSIAAHGLGQELDITFDFKPMYPAGDHKTEQVIAQLRLKEASQPVKDFDAELLVKRRTSRLPYDGRAVPDELIAELKAESTRFGTTFEINTEPQIIESIKELNKNSLFYDLEDTGIREELKGWLRYSKREAHEKKDGLSAECLHLPGRILRSFFYHHRVWTNPLMKKFVEKVYLSTMKGIGTVAWIRGPYVTIEDWVRSGRLMIRLWLILTNNDIYWQPYGSVITNDRSRQEMLRFLNLSDENGGKNMVWLLLRMGYSKEPPRSERLPIQEVLL